MNKQNRFVDKGKSLSNSVDTLCLPRHRWYYFKEGFSPNLVKMALDELHCSEISVFDPFCGSGTVALSCRLNDIYSVGYEVNPFLVFLANTKLLQTTPYSFELCLREVIEAAAKGTISPLEEESTFCESSHASKWLFNRDVLRGFEGGWKATTYFDMPEKKLMQLALISAAMDTCNAQKDGKCLRYRNHWKELAFNRNTFLKNLTLRTGQILQDLELAPLNKTCEAVKMQDARHLHHVDQDMKFRLCVTSPPYLNSFDYSDVYRPELFLGKHVANNTELQLLRHKTLRSHMQINWVRPSHNDFGETYHAVLERIVHRPDLFWNKRLPMMIQAYFEDIMLVLQNLRAMAHNEAVLWLVVSTSAYVGVEIPVDLIIAYIGNMVGWEAREVNLLRYLRSSGQHWNNYAGPDDEKPRLRESVIIFHAA
ncbi:MAG: hypothetical protein H0W02_04285 [Ktedonobacteraceae bacterium]|nr:hypothetical protein [Ktedonobacteraceae bacterium]